LGLHGWFFKIATGELFAYDPARGQFAPLTTPPISGQHARQPS
jgi:carbonic anhydrase